MEPTASQQPTPESDGAPETGIDRGATGIRIVLTLLFAVIARLIEVLLTVVVLFGLGFALVTRQPPSRKLREFANQVCTYLYRTTRYLTYNESEPPFPFTDFPDAIEPPTDDYDDVSIVPRDLPGGG